MTYVLGISSFTLERNIIFLLGSNIKVKSKDLKI